MMAMQQQADGVMLSVLFGDCVPEAYASICVADMSLDSRSIGPGGLFLACQGVGQSGQGENYGSKRHGLEFIRDALDNGAIAVAWEPAGTQPPAALPDGIAAIKVPNLRRRLGSLADLFFGQPSAAMHVTGITGTNGKTTCAWLLANALEYIGESSGLIGTLGHGRVDELEASDLTTPDCVTVHRRLAGLHDLGAKHVAMEVSSHALDQGRVDGVRMHTSVFTNLSRDHLDYHGSKAAYGAAKARLFSVEGQSLAVICASDAFGLELLDRAAANRIIAVSDNGADVPSHVSCLQIHTEDTGSNSLAVRFDGDFGSGVFQTRLIGRFNVMNLGLVLGVLFGSGYSQAEVLPAMESLSAPPGRMETLTTANAPLVVVDYSHTPDALRQALIALRGFCHGDLRCVFGCGGERDSGKRPLMAHAAAEYADHIIVTDDNPRNEDADRIVSEIVAGFPGDTSYLIERDRAEAIALAIENSSAGDCVLVAGKGHEDYQIIGTERRHFSDRETVARVLGVAL